MLTFTDRAREVVNSFLAQSDGELEALRITTEPGSPIAPRFELTLVAKSERGEDEREVEGGGFPVLVKETDIERLEGATVDYVDRVNESGFEVRPAPREKQAGDESTQQPTGEIADQVRTVLNTQVNPAIASHGGAINLVDVDGTEVFVEMSGGCQGCAMSRMTLSQGVERMLKQALPEITAVHDVTDHSSGSNPYFEH
jgi:Fe/S biogenesis protein NfuA